MSTWKKILQDGDVEGVTGNPVVVTTGTPVAVSLGDPDSVQGGGALGSLSSSTVDPTNDVALVWDANANVWKQMPIGQFIVNMAYDELVISESRFHTLNDGNRWVITDEDDNGILSVTAGSAPIDNGVIAASWLRTKWLRIPDNSSPVKEVNFVAPTTNYTNSQTYKLPTDYPSSTGQVLSSDTNGVLSWSTAGSGSDTNLANTDLTATSSSRVFKLAPGSSGLFFQNNSGQNVFSMFSLVNGFSTTALFGGMQIAADNSGQQGCLKLFEGGTTSNHVCLMANSSATEDQKLFFPAALPTANQILEVQSVSGSDVNLDWVDTPSGGGGVTIDNNTNDFLLTATGTANTVNGETNLRFTGQKLYAYAHMEFKPTPNARTGELYDAGEASEYTLNANVSSGDVITIPKAAVVTAFKVYTIDPQSLGPSLVDASFSSTNINQVAFIAPANADSNQFYLRGMMTIPAASINGTFSSSHGDPIYLDPSSSGTLTFTGTTTSNTYRRQMGYVINQVSISSSTYYVCWFDPSPEYVKIS